MKYFDEFQNGRLAEGILRAIHRVSRRRVTLMEVCGTHTVAMMRHGIKKLLPPSIKVLSGPGCPVCVTPQEDIDQAITLSRHDDVILTTFGDMMRVPGTESSLIEEKTQGADVRVVYSVSDAVKIATGAPRKNVVFLGVGFETTSPSVAAAVLEAERAALPNLFILTCHKLIPPAMNALLDHKEVQLDGFICPGHVTTIIGVAPYESIVRKYHVPCVVAGFEPLDILLAILMLVEQIEENAARVESQYTRAVRRLGNLRALEILGEVFERMDARWRGLGLIPESGLGLRERFARFDARKAFALEVKESREPKGCICGDILRGLALPTDCALFGSACIPERPVGPCMVSSEGSCAAFFKYGAYEDFRSKL